MSNNTESGARSMSMTTELALPLDFTKPLETESGEPVKYICHDVIEYKQARVCVDIDTGVVYSSPYAGMKIRNVIESEYESLRESIEDAASAYYEFDNGWISHMDCCDRSHEYLMFVKEPKNVLALVEALEAALMRNAELEASHCKLRETLAGIHNTIRTDGSYTPLAAILNAVKRAHEESAALVGVAVEGEYS